MPVSVLMPRAKSRPQTPRLERREDVLDKIIKGLSVAQATTGVAVNIDRLMNVGSEREIQQTLAKTTQQTAELKLAEAQFAKEQAMLPPSETVANKKFQADEIFKSELKGKRELANIKAKAENVIAKKPTTDQFKAGTFGIRAQDSYAQLAKLAETGFSGTGLRTAAEKTFFPEGLKSTEVKLLEQTQRNFVNALLRRESGAAISDPEFVNANKQYFPQNGDVPEVLAQKERNREVAIAALTAEGGGAIKQIQAQLQLGNKEKKTGPGLISNAMAAQSPQGQKPLASPKNMKSDDLFNELLGN